MNLFTLKQCFYIKNMLKNVKRLPVEFWDLLVVYRGWLWSVWVACQCILIHCENGVEGSQRSTGEKLIGLRANSLQYTKQGANLQIFEWFHV